MSATLNIPYTTPSNYSYDSDKVEITGGVARLKMQQDNLDFTEDFVDDTDFTYDSSKAEFSGGKIQQKDQRPANFSFGATYTSSINGSWGGGVLTGTAYGGASISGEKLDLAHNDERYVDYDADLNADSQQVGAVKFKVTPNYSGAPPNDRWFFAICKANNDAKNLIQLRHSNSGPYLRLHMYDSTGALIVEQLCGVWNPVSGTTYEIEVNWDLTTGANRLFIDGIQSGTTGTSTGTRDSNIGLLRIGNDYNKGAISDFKIEDLVIFNTVQHTSNYTPGYTLSETIYATTNATLPEMQHSGIGTIKLFNTFSTTEGGTPRYTLQIGRSGNYLYWDGDSWEISDGTYSQANDATTFNTNCGSLDIDGEEYVQFKVHFEAGNSVQDYVDELTANMNVDIGYSTDAQKININTTFKSSELLTFSETATKPTNTECKYTIEVDGTEKYYSGGLQNSNGTYSQANTASEISTNIEEFLSTRATVQLHAFLYTSDDQVTPELDLNSITYDTVIADPNEPTIIEIEGFIYNFSGAESEVQIKARPYPTGYISEGVFINHEWKLLGTTNADGWFSGEVYLQPDNKYIELKIGSESFYTELPNQATVDLKDLTLIAVED